MKLDDDQQRLLAGLTEHPGWPVLERIVREWGESESSKLAARLLMREQTLDRLEASFLAGQFHGMKDVINRVDAARKAVEKEALKEREKSERTIVRG